MKAISQITRNTTNKILAMLAAAPAIPVNPSIAANIAIIKNTSDQCNIRFPFLLWNMALSMPK
jgi:hypothetical protein